MRVVCILLQSYLLTLLLVMAWGWRCVPAFAALRRPPPAPFRPIGALLHGDYHSGSSPFAGGDYHPLVTKLARVIDPWRPAVAGAQLLVCVSGGLDSVALLRLLHSLNADPAWGFDLHVLHFDHGLRAESGEEAAFVQQLAAQLCLPFHGRAASKNLRAVWAKSGMQEGARRWRRRESAALLGGLPPADGGKFVVTAHHRDDQVETVLLKLLRGVHLSRIHGMEVLLDPNEHGARAFRPLVAGSIGKDELRGFLEASAQAWREDPSNQSPKYKRNHLRLDVVPALEKLAGGPRALAARVAALSDQSLALRSWVEGEASAWGGRHLKRAGAGDVLLPLAEWRALPPPVRTEVLHRFVAGASGVGAVPFSQLTRVERQIDHGRPQGWELHLPGAVSVERVGAMLRCSTLAEEGAAAGDLTLKVAGVSVVISAAVRRSLRPGALVLSVAPAPPALSTAPGAPGFSPSLTAPPGAASTGTSAVVRGLPPGSSLAVATAALGAHYAFYLFVLLETSMTLVLNLGLQLGAIPRTRGHGGLRRVWGKLSNI